MRQSAFRLVESRVYHFGASTIAWLCKNGRAGVAHRIEGEVIEHRAGLGQVRPRRERGGESRQANVLWCGQR